MREQKEEIGQTPTFQYPVPPKAAEQEQVPVCDDSHRSEPEVRSSFNPREQREAGEPDAIDNIRQQMEEIRARREGNKDFYDEMYKDFAHSKVEKHDGSPVGRLIQHKNTAVIHKSAMKEIDKGDYHMVYVMNPDKSYVVNPHEGELNYHLVDRNPKKFYDQVFHSSITKHKFEEDPESPHRNKHQTPVKITSKTTVRPHQKIIDKVTIAMNEKFQEFCHDLRAHYGLSEPASQFD